MALWLGKDGVMKCAAQHKPQKGDVYIDDRGHYKLFLAGKIKTKKGKVWRST